MAANPPWAGGPGLSAGLTDDETCCVLHVRMTGVGVDADTLTITGTANDTQVSTARVYELDTAADPGVITAGRVRVNISGGATAANTITALVAAINGDASRSVEALDIGGDIMALIGLRAGENVVAAEALTNGVLSHTTAVGAASAAHRGLIAGTYAVIAENVTAWALGATVEQIVAGAHTTSAPQLYALEIYDANGIRGSTALLRANWTQINTNFYGLIVRDPGAVLSATDRISHLSLAAVDNNA